MDGMEKTEEPVTSHSNLIRKGGKETTVKTHHKRGREEKR
jgi:hypothetical protein